MTLDVFLTARTLRPDDLRGRTAVMIDVLRASSTICTALANGARTVIPASDPGAAARMAESLDSDAVVLGGERDGVAIDGTLGNSPLAYPPDVVAGKRLILATTNGTPLLHTAAAAEAVLVGCFLNAQALVDQLVRDRRDVALLCAGWRGGVGLEDTLCAGLLLHRIWGGRCPDDASDEARLAFTHYAVAGDDLHWSIRRSQHGRRLLALGAADDVAYCAQLDTLSAVPHLDADGQLRPISAP